MLELGPDLMEYGSSNSSEFEASHDRDLAFEQLLWLAASYASSQAAQLQSGAQSFARKSPVSDDVEVRAYQIYLGRGGLDGHDLDDWLQAERQVLEELKKSKASLRLALAFGVLKNSAQA
jgi:Protein of unknown function (DUF2934)